MRNFLLRRLISLIPVLLGVTFISFLLMSLTPGDFLTTMSMNPQISPEHISRMRHDFGLDQPWYVQYSLWLYRLSPFRWPFGMKMPDLGYSFAYKMPVTDLIGERFGNTLLLSVFAEILIWCIGIPLGILAAIKSHHWQDRLSSFGVFLGISFPQVLLSLLALLLAARTGWFPIGGMHRFGYETLPGAIQFLDLIHHLILPATVLAITETAFVMRFMRSSLIETLTAGYIQTARAKGLPKGYVVLKHAVPNAMNPLITMFGLSLANLISGSFLVEIIMGWPGLGKLTYEAILAKDLYVIMASLLMATFFLIAGNLLADLLLAFSDPRIRYE